LTLKLIQYSDMQEFLEKLSTVWKKATTPFRKITHWLSNLLYKLLSKILGEERLSGWVGSYRHYQELFWQKYYERVDINSPYYRPVVTTWKALLYGIGGFAFYIFCVETNFLWLCGSMPSVEDLQNPKVAQASEIYSADGKLIGKLYTENRTPIDFDSLSPHLVKALIATEDVRFYEHSGIDSREENQPVAFWGTSRSSEHSFIKPKSGSRPFDWREISRKKKF
jgi:penicillin-binding protein 1A